MFDNLNAVLKLDERDFTRSADKAESSMGSFADTARSSGKRMQRAGAMMTAGITAPLTAMGVMSARVAGNFEQKMNNSIAVMGDVDEAMRTRLEETAREVAKNTTYSASQAAEAFYFLSSAGLEAEESMAALPQVADFAAAGNMDLAEATDVATNVMSAFNIEAENMAEVTDIMSATVANHNQTMEGLSSAMSQVAPIASTLGYSLEETSTALGMMGDVGIQAEKAGTALRNVMSQLSDETSPVSKKLREMGVATRDSEGNLVTMAQLLRNMESAGVEAGQAASVFGTEAGPAMAALMNQGSSALAENTEAIGAMEGATKRMAETQRDTLNAEMAMARSNIEDVGISMGTTMLPALKAVTSATSDLASGLQGLSENQRKVVLGLAALAAIAGPVVAGIGTIGVIAPAVATGLGTLSAGAGLAAAGANGLAVTLFGATIPALLATNVALGPITVPIWAIIGAVGALIAIAGALWYAWDNNVLGIKDTTTDAFRTVKGWLDAAPTWVLALLGPIGWLYAAWSENLFGIQDIVGDVFGWIGDKIGWLIDRISDLPGIDLGESNAEEAVPDPDEVADRGAAAGAAGGEAYRASFEEMGRPSAAALAPSSGPVEGEMTDAMRSVLESGVSGYKSEGIADAETEIDQNLFDAMAATEGGATASRLGVTEQEFATLVDRFGGGSGGGTSTGTATSASPTAVSPSRAGGTSAEDIGRAVRDALEGLGLVLDGELELDEGHVVRITRATLGEERDSLDRGVGGSL